MRQGWETKLLKELCLNYKNDIVDGPFGANLKREHYKTSGVPVLKIQNIKPYKIILKKMDYVSPNKAKELRRHAYIEGDIIITKLGLPLGISAIVQDIPEGVIVADLVRVRAEKIDTKYLCYHLNSPATNAFLNSQQGGATRPRVKISAVRELPINVPPLPEQKRIVAILDEAFAGIDKTITNTKKNLTNARELFETTLNDMFTAKSEGWVEKRLEETCENLDKKRIPITKSKRVSGKIPYYGASGIVDHVEDFIFNEDLLLVSEDGANLLARTYPIAFTISGKSWVNNHAHVLRFKESSSQSFVEYYLNSISLKPYVSGMAQPKLNQKMLNSILVPWPPIKIQKKIVKDLDGLTRQTQRLETIYQQKLDALTELKQSLLQKAFAGELTSDFIAEQATTIDITSPAFTANVIFLSHHLHEKKKREKTFGRVKAQKDLHLVESIGGIDLGRQPIKDAAGPNDSAHMRRAQDWAKQQQFFEFVKRPNGRGYDFKKLARYKEMKLEAIAMIKSYRDDLEKITNLLIQKDTEQAEVFTTVHTAWNNLIIEGTKITQKAILHEARENWHIDKLKIPLSKFKEAIAEIKQKNLQPDGTAKYVGKLEEELF